MISTPQRSCDQSKESPDVNTNGKGLLPDHVLVRMWMIQAVEEGEGGERGGGKEERERYMYM